MTVTAEQPTYTTPMLVNGRWIPGGDGTFEVLNPATGQVLAQVAAGSRSDIDTAVGAARAALSGEWGTMPGTERLASLDLAEARSRALPCVRGHRHSRGNDADLHVFAGCTSGAHTHPVGPAHSRAARERVRRSPPAARPLPGRHADGGAPGGRRHRLARPGRLSQVLEAPCTGEPTIRGCTARARAADHGTVQNRSSPTACWRAGSGLRRCCTGSRTPSALSDQHSARIRQKLDGVSTAKLWSALVAR